MTRKTPPTPRRKALKDDVVRMRISAEQKQGLVAAAEQEGLELSAWLRQVALRAAGLLPHSGAMNPAVARAYAESAAKFWRASRELGAESRDAGPGELAERDRRRRGKRLR